MQIETLPRDTHVEVAFNRADKKNAITAAMYRALADALTQADRAHAPAIVLHGHGDAFCAGNDVADFITNPPTDPSAPVFAFLHALAAIDTPLIAAIKGSCVGIGATLLLHCDHVAAADNSRIIFPFVKLGIVPEAGSTLLLPRLIGATRAAHVLLSGEPIPAAQALDWGLVNRVVPLGEELAAARDFAARLAAAPPASVRLTKRLLRNDRAAVLAQIERENLALGEQLQSPEFLAAARAFLNKGAS